MQSPFKFLDSYTLEDKDNFFGREKEVEQLYTMVNQNRLILVYGQSGTGKTSLVQCGLASQFESVDWYSIFIRRGEDINRSFDDALRKALKDELYDSYPETIEELYALYVRPIYLLFDQFEELFILGTPEERALFFQHVTSILEARIPCRIIFIMREEYLAHLYEFEKIIPNLLDRRLRVEGMSYKNVGTVVQQSFERFNINLEDTDRNTEQIINNLSSGSAGIHLPYLQVYLDMLYREEYQRTYPNKAPSDPFPFLEITTSEIDDFGKIDNVLDKFLEEQSDTLQQKLQKQYDYFPENGVLRILDIFVTEEGTKRPLKYSRQEDQLVLPPKASIPDLSSAIFSEALLELEKLRLLRFSDDTIELSHDTLAILIDQKRTNEQRQLNAILRQLKSAYAAHSRTREYLTQKQLTAYEPFIPKLKLDDTILAFVKNSKAHVEDLAFAEKQRQERELELTRQKLATEQRAAKRQRIFSGVIGAALVLAIVLGAYAAKQSKTLAANQAQIEREKDKANELLINFKREQADRVKGEVEDIVRRALILASRGHLSEQDSLLEDAKAKLQPFQDNPLLDELVEEVDHLLN